MLFVGTWALLAVPADGYLGKESSQKSEQSNGPRITDAHLAFDLSVTPVH